MSKEEQILSDDHDAVSEVLKQLLTALDNQDVQTSYARLDLVWARLAIHIRAEHLHLFPAVIDRLTKAGDYALVTDLSEAQTIVEHLRTDHDFFMRQLGDAIGILRALPNEIVTARDEATLVAVRDDVLQITARLVTHNEIEESQIYRWSSTILTKSEQLELAARINAELENRPPRFSAEVWANRL